MSERSETMLEAVRQDDLDAAVVFVHGFGGREGGTFGRFPQLLVEASALTGWDVWDLGYATSLAPDVRGVWAANPDIGKLGTYLRTRLSHGPLAGYASIAIVAHSMGGLVVQRALVDAERDQDELLARIGHVFMFGTPSGGLRKAGPFAFWSRALRDMGRDSNFITDLRVRWSAAFDDARQRPFHLWVVAGDRDEFVPATSSLEPFPEGVQHVVHGDHVEIVKPSAADDLSVQVVVGGLQGDAAPSGRWNAARVAVETRRFQEAIDRLAGHADELDDAHLVQLALALESVGRTDEALGHLEARESLGSDARGVLAGRLKRRWMAEGRASDGEEARDLYAAGHRTAVDREDWDQALYHGINEAFMLATTTRSGTARSAAADLAREVLTYCEQPAVLDDHWRDATVGEARLHLGEVGDALAAYRRALEKGPSPREISSMYHQARALAEALHGDEVARRLDAVFRGEEAPTGE